MQIIMFWTTKAKKRKCDLRKISLELKKKEKGKKKEIHI